MITLDELISDVKKTIDALARNGVVCEKTDALLVNLERLQERDINSEMYEWLRQQCINGDLTIASVKPFGLLAWSGDDPDAAIHKAMSAVALREGEE